MRLLPVLACSAAAAALALGLEGCGKSCNAMACGDVTFLVRLEARCWPDGSYEVRGALDGTPFSIPVELPLQPGVPAHDGAASVNVDDRYGFLSFLVATATPRDVELELRYEGETLLAERFAPEYRQEEINGEGCEPLCTTSDDQTVAVPAEAAAALCAL